MSAPTVNDQDRTTTATAETLAEAEQDLARLIRAHPVQIERVVDRKPIVFEIR
jgi:hypothetical protein